MYLSLLCCLQIQLKNLSIDDFAKHAAALGLGLPFPKGPLGMAILVSDGSQDASNRPFTLQAWLAKRGMAFEPAKQVAGRHEGAAESAHGMVLEPEPCPPIRCGEGARGCGVW